MRSRGSKVRSSTMVEATAARLGECSLVAQPGQLLGSEDTLVAELQVSRTTLRQAARLVEREGLIHVRRGINGGYFAARPDVRQIESTVSGYLGTLTIDFEEVTSVGSALWVEVVRRAAEIDSDASRAVADKQRTRLNRLKLDAEFPEIAKIEEDFRNALFALTNARYAELIFHINLAFARRWMPAGELPADRDIHRHVITSWRNAKLMEVEAIYSADQELATLAARHSRKIWHQMIWRSHTRDGGA